VGLAVAVADDQKPQFDTQTKQNEPIFILGVFVIRNDSRVLVQKSCSRLFERHTMFRLVCTALSWIPLKLEFADTYSVTTT